MEQRQRKRHQDLRRITKIIELREFQAERKKHEIEELEQQNEQKKQRRRLSPPDITKNGRYVSELIQKNHENNQHLFERPCRYELYDNLNERLSFRNKKSRNY